MSKDNILKPDFEIKEFRLYDILESTIEGPQVFTNGVPNTYSLPHGKEYVPITLGYSDFPAALGALLQMPQSIHRNSPRISADFFGDSAYIRYTIGEDDINIEAASTSKDFSEVTYSSDINLRFLIYRDKF